MEAQINDAVNDFINKTGCKIEVKIELHEYETTSHRKRFAAQVSSQIIKDLRSKSNKSNDFGKALRLE